MDHAHTYGAARVEWNDEHIVLRVPRDRATALARVARAIFYSLENPYSEYVFAVEEIGVVLEEATELIEE